MSDKNDYELIIIGAGPAGAAASIYAARKKLDTLLLSETFGGQSTVSPSIENWVGTKSISGTDFAKQLEDHVRVYEDGTLDIQEGARASDLTQDGEEFVLETTKGTYRAEAVLITTGAHRRQLKIPGAAEFENKGVVYCASCDGPLFADKDVVVIGGGNAGFETAAQLLAYTKSVTLLQHSDQFNAEEVTVDKVLSHKNMTAHLNAEPEEIKGDAFTETLVYKDLETDEEHEIPAEGVFVEIGLVPNTAYAADILETNQINQLVVDPHRQRSSVEGIWAAGDCTDGLYHQNNIAAGDAVKAVEDIYLWLKTN
ncbi:MAG: FAD-dependent oxidoreductase [Candidatus Paceibacterota bacterium]